MIYVLAVWVIVGPHLCNRYGMNRADFFAILATIYGIILVGSWV